MSLPFDSEILLLGIYPIDTPPKVQYSVHTKLLWYISVRNKLETSRCLH